MFEDVTYNKARQMIAQAVNEAVETVSQEESEPLFTASQGEDGSVQSLTVDASAMNRVKRPGGVSRTGGAFRQSL